jgi:RNA polymerase sigma-70 factor (ECF subfamily)
MKVILQESGLSQVKSHKTGKETSEKEAEKSLPTSFEDHFHQHWAGIYRLLLRMVNDPSEAEDLTLETFLHLYQSLAKMDTFNVGGWLFRVATNLGLQSIRSYKRRERYELAAGRDALDGTPDLRPAEILAEKEERQMVRSALGMMDPRQSQLLVMRYSGLAYKEIAQALNLSPTSIGPLLLRAEREFEKRYRALTQEEA